MKKMFVLLLCLGLVGCETFSQKINSVQLGMSKDEVIHVMGQPISTYVKDGNEYLNYKIWRSKDNTGLCGEYVPYSVSIKDGKVDAYGRTGDSGTKCNFSNE